MASDSKSQHQERFTGIPDDAFVFYSELERDNSRAFWEANKTRYQTSVRQPATALANALRATFPAVGDFHLYRPHNDLRFHKNRPPYKTHQGAYSESDGGAGFYFQISEAGLMIAYGYYMMARDQLGRFRAAIDDEASGAELRRLVDDLPSDVEVGAVGTLKTAPRGYPRDHPRVELLRRKGLMVMRHDGVPAWVHTPEAVDRIREFWRSGAPINSWLDTHVGPSEEPPPDAW